jgi:hypothetical protein
MPNISPSRAEYMERCARYLRKPDDGAVTGADEGILMHEAVETDNLDILESEDQIKDVNFCIQYRDNIKTGLHTFVHEAEGVTSDTLLDIRELEMSYKRIIPRCYMDQILIGVDAEGRLVAHVLDWKFVRKSVTEITENFQIELYALTLDRWLRKEHNIEVDLIVGHLVCPRIDDIMVREFTPADIAKVKARLETLKEKCDDPFTPATPHDKVCDTCRWAYKCDALHSNAQAALSAVNQVIPVPGTFDIALATPDDKAKARAWADVFINLGESLKKTVNKDAFELGEAPPGYNLVRKRGKTSITDNEGALAVLQTIMPLQAIANGATFSLTKLAEAALASGIGTTKKDARAQIESVLEAHLKEGPETQFLQRSRKVSIDDIIAGTNLLT